MPPEWQEVFDSLKLSKDDLQNKDIMSIIAEETILTQVKRQADQDENKELQNKIKNVEQENRIQQQSFQ